VYLVRVYDDRFTLWYVVSIIRREEKMITGDLVKCRESGSLGVVAKIPPLKGSDIYQVLWFEDAIMTYEPFNNLEEIPFNADDTLDDSYIVSTFDV